MVSRKKAAGKARKAAKAKAREEAEEGGNNNLMANNEDQQSPLRSVESRYRNDPNLDLDTECRHAGAVPSDDIFHFLNAFSDKFDEAIQRKQHVAGSFVEARNATRDEYAEVWKDSAKLTLIISYLLWVGTDAILEGEYAHARGSAIYARFFEQYKNVMLKQSEALFNWPKLEETYYADMHTLVKFFRHRIPCSCLDEKYEEVKSITKMGYCYNPQCRMPNRKVERSQTKYCSRCRNATYCSRECQKADWTMHKPTCDKNAAAIAEFEA